jgi:hypothetical protein
MLHLFHRIVLDGKMKKFFEKKFPKNREKIKKENS